MKLIKDNSLLLLLIVAVTVAGTSLMVVSQKVYDTQKNVQALDQELLAKQWDIRALKAELAYLSRPDRLEQITSAIAQSVNPTANNVSISPVAYQLSNDLPAGMSLLPPLKPASAIFHKRKTTKYSPIKRVSAEVAAPTKQIQKNNVKDKGAGFASLLENLGGQ